MHNLIGYNSLSITEQFEQVVTLNSNKIAIIHGDAALTYDCLNRKANQLANYLMSQSSVERGNVIAIFADSSEWVIISMLAILKAGCVYLPLDSKYPEERIKYIIQDTQTSLILTEAIFLEKIQFSLYPILIIDEFEAKITAFSTSNPKINSNSDDPAYIMYTSGTSGVPNGVLIPQKGIIRLVNSDFIPFSEELTFMQLAPLGFDASTFEIWGALLHGNKLVIFRHHIPEFLLIQEYIQKYKVTCLWLTASLFNAIIDEAYEILNGIKYLLTGGEALSVSHIKKAQQNLPETIFINGYGPTECTTFACCYKIPVLLNMELNSIPIGKPISLTSTYLLDEKLNQVSQGEIGELYIGGEGLAIKYLNNIKLTNERFISYETLEKGNIRLYKTGDLCRKHIDGTIDFIGRIDHQVKINGFRIETTEIEICLKKYPQISDAIVLVKHIGETKRLIAFIVPKTESFIRRNENIPIIPINVLEKNELNQYILKWLPAFMIPGAIIEVESFPLNKNGKIDRQALLSIDIKVEKTNKREQFEESENRIRLLCEKILAIHINNKNENFFELGGESLSIAQLLFHISQEYNVTIPINYFYNEPTLSTILKIITNEESEEFDLINSRIKKAKEVFEEKDINDLTTLENEYSIIQIKKGKGEPLFIAPGLFGNVFSFIEFANKINIHNPIYVFEYPITKLNRFVNTNMTDLAKYFSLNLRKIQPDGNYQILGFSFGGRLIFEIAHQLELTNHKISFLGIIDAEGVDNENKINKNKFMFEINIFMKLPLKLKLKFIRYTILEKIINKFRHNLITKTKKISDQVIKQKLLENDFFKVWYSFHPDYKLNCDLHLIKASNEWPGWLLYYVKYLYPDLFFKNNLNGKLIIEEIDCDHMGFFKSPHLNKLAETIENIIENKS